jgi:WD40 repeat protein
MNVELLLGVMLLGGLAWWFADAPERDDATRSTRTERPGHLSRVNWVVFAPDGQTVGSCSSDATAKLWYVGPRGMSPQVRVSAADATLPHASEVYAAEFSPDGRMLAILGVETLTLWSCRPNAYEMMGEHPGEPQLCLAWAPDGRSIAVGLADGTIQFLEMPAGRQLKRLRGHSGMVRRLAFTPDGRLLASSNTDGKVKLWDVAPGREIGTIWETAGAFHALAAAPDGRSLALAAYGQGPAQVIL